MKTTNETLTPAELAQNLRQFTGTEQWYRHPLFRRYLYTDGVQYLAGNAGAYWLLDMIFGFQYEYPKVKAQPFQVWKLEVNEDQTALLTCTDGNYNAVHKHELTYTDFPLKEISLWLGNSGEYDVLYLPSEH